MYEREMKLAVKAAITAGKYLLMHYKPSVDSQVGKDIKLSADRESETIIIDILSSSGYPVLSEESGEVQADGCNSDMRWIVDPLDGTANYWRGLTELACVSIALWKGDEPVLGVVNRFATGEVYSGVVGDGAMLNGQVIHTSTTHELKDAFLATGFPVKRDYETESLDKFIKQVQVCKKIRMLGAAAIMGSLVSAGKLDIYAEEQIMLWDIAASAALVIAAGGVADIKMLKDSQCICRLFANETLRTAFLTI